MTSLSVKFKSSNTGKSINVSLSNERILLLAFLVNFLHNLSSLRQGNDLTQDKELSI